MPSVSAIYCDDIREEVGDKLSYMGVYGQTLFVRSGFPIVIPKLCVVVTFSVGVAEKPTESVTCQIGFAGQEKPLFRTVLPLEGNIARSGLKDANGHGITMSTLRFNMQFVPLSVSRPSTLETIFPFKNGILEAGSLEILAEP